MAHAGGTRADARRARQRRVLSHAWRLARLGRDFGADEDQAGSADVIILSYGTWHTRFGASQGIIGQPITLGDKPYTVVGVLPRDFQFVPRGGAEIWSLLQPTGSCEMRRSCHNLEGVARLRPGATVEEARAELSLLAEQLEREYPDTNRGQGTSVAPLVDVILGDVRPVLLVLLAGAGLLLVIGCINVASLLLVRAESRQREIALRSALGATRTRLVSQFATEGMLLAAAGGALGTLLGVWAMQLLVSLVPPGQLPRMPYLADTGLNARTLAAAVLVSLVAGVACTLVPIVRLARPARSEALADGGRGSAGTTWRRVGARLVMFELATAVVLLTGAGLLGKSLYTLLQVDLGFQPAGVATFWVAAAQPTSATPDHAVLLAHEIVREVRALPGVRSVGLTSVPPVSFNGNTDWIRIAGRPYSGGHIEVNRRDVSADYFTTIGATLVEGRHFTNEDDAARPRVVIVNRALALLHFPGESPIGHRIGDTSLSPASVKEIVGVIEDIREGPLDAEIWPAVYYPFNQNPSGYFATVVRTSQDPRALLPTLHTAVRSARPDVATMDGVSMEDHIGRSDPAQLRRSSAGVIGGFAAVALVLATVGLHGVVAYTVGRRTREIGVRIALGATSRSVYRLVLGDAALIAGVGISAGLALSVVAAMFMRALLFGTPPWDATTLTAVSLVLGVATLIAAWLPARRAASMDPVRALRIE